MPHKRKKGVKTDPKVSPDPKVNADDPKLHPVPEPKAAPKVQSDLKVHAGPEANADVKAQAAAKPQAHAGIKDKADKMDPEQVIQELKKQVEKLMSEKKALEDDVRELILLKAPLRPPADPPKSFAKEYHVAMRERNVLASMIGDVAASLSSDTHITSKSCGCPTCTQKYDQDSGDDDEFYHQNQNNDNDDDDADDGDWN